MRSVRVVTVVAISLVFALLATGAFAAEIPVEDRGVSPDAFESARSCGCHSAFIEQWSGSMHAQALTDPLYLTKLAEANKATDGKIGAFCEKCHGPAAEMAGQNAKGAKRDAGPSEGVTCSFCHQVTGMAKGEPSNTSQLVTPDGVRRAQIKDPKAPHPAAYSELHEKAEICGGCHNVNHPVNGMHLEATYSEWAEGPYAKEGIVCQDCHMSRQPGEIGPSRGQAAAGAPERDNIYQMVFVGGQVALGPSDIATARLKSAAKIEMEAPEIVAAEQSGKVTVKITNVGAGHYIPTGLTEIRQMWLEVTATDAAGKSTKVGEHIFGTILEDDEGNAPVELWEATKIKSDDRIPPRESVTDEFTFTMPAGAEGMTLKAALLYKSVPDEFARKAGVENPVTEMAVAEQAIYISDEARANAVKEQTGGQSGESGTGLTLIIALGATAVLVVGAVVWSRLRKAGSA